MTKTKLDFEEIREIRNRVRTLLKKHVQTLAVYRAPTFGYVHRFDETASSGDVTVTKDDPSKASTATCIESLVARGETLESAGNTAELLNWLIVGVDKGSAGLPDKNAFTTAFMLDAAIQTIDHSTHTLTASQIAIKDAAIARLEQIILHEGPKPLPKSLGGVRPKKGQQPSKSRAQLGAANIEPYPPTAFLTQLVIRTLKHSGSINSDVEKAARKWSHAAMEHEIALLVADDDLADAFALSYAAITFATLSNESRLTPQEKRILSLAVDRVFAAQNTDGSWPRSRPLFHYSNVGNAYCFEYEMLTQLLACDHLGDDIQRHVPHLIRAVNHLDKTRYDLELPNGEKGAAWASGHHPQIRGPESWSTASVYHFLHLIERFLSRMLREDLFARLKSNSGPIAPKPADLAEFGARMLDSVLYVDDRKLSLKDTIRDEFLAPLKKEAVSVQRGRAFPGNVKMSMLMFGPPGTSKTTLAKDIATVLGWPLLEVDPSHILLNGWDHVHATAIRLLDDLAELDCAVVLLDEFDELVRTRDADRGDNGEASEKGKEKGEPISRFFTTAMLPKLIKLNKERRIVLLMATNFVDQFDDAIAREGRFDTRVQVLPPSAAAKIAHSEFANIKVLDDIEHFELRGALDDFTFQETQRFNELVKGVTDKAKAESILEQFKDKCTMLKDNGKWKEDCKTQRKWVRI
jgi:hypothetical protein